MIPTNQQEGAHDHEGYEGRFRETGHVYNVLVDPVLGLSGFPEQQL